MKRLTRLGLAAAFGISMALSTSALSLGPGDAAYAWTYFPPEQKTPSEIQAYLESQGEDFGGASLEELFLENSNSTTLNVPDLSNYENLWLVAKDGNATPTAYLFDLTGLGFTGGEIQLDGLWPGQGELSNSRIYGTPGTSVPDGGTTLLLLGVACSVLGLSGMKERRK